MSRDDCLIDIPAYDGMLHVGWVRRPVFRAHIAADAGLVPYDDLDGMEVFDAHGRRIGFLEEESSVDLVHVPSPSYPDMCACGRCGWTSDNWFESGAWSIASGLRGLAYRFCPNCGSWMSGKVREPDTCCAEGAIRKELT